jgi:hypothetical protein
MRSHVKRYVGTCLLTLVFLLTTASSCSNSINIKNSSTRAASVYVSIPESSGRSLLNVAPGEEDAAELGDSGIYTVYVMADTVVTGALTNVRDDLEARLKNATSPSQIQDLTAKLQAISKFSDQLANRATSCGGKVDQGDAYVTVGWDDSKQVFTAGCVSKSPDANANPNPNP